MCHEGIARLGKDCYQYKLRSGEQFYVKLYLQCEVEQLKQRRMMTSNQVTSVYETLLCIPGMNDQVKLDLKISRKQVLLLSQIIERGLRAEEGERTGMLSVSKQTGDELSQIAKDCLEKAGLVELSSKLKALENK
jgi:hypothetical protein